MYHHHPSQSVLLVNSEESGHTIATMTLAEWRYNLIREHELLTFSVTIYKQTRPVSLVIYNLFTQKSITYLNRLL